MVPVVFGATRENCEVVGEGDAAVDGVGTGFPFITMAGSVVAGEVG